MNQSAMHIHVFLFLYAFDHVHAAVDRTTAVETIEIICQQKRDNSMPCFPPCLPRLSPRNAATRDELCMLLFLHNHLKAA